jgi:AraC-like DNA-binding protein
VTHPYKNRISHVAALNSVITKYDCFCFSAIHKGDERMNLALAYLSDKSDQIVPLIDVADHCNLSSSRFLHLFKEQTGITYRRAQLWNKLMKGITQFGKMSLTEIAHYSGFSDSAHFSRTFKENFGFSPRDFIKISQFVQV